ncbi:MAG: fibrobacter succinogenes major paralogous domain-containing protein [Chitinispirillales bacterium]|jgi:uncharacterized protein (TIGR02145 family)|nr:fibrobacter succinogenes major paralogous domain-containing protein [Chitinispirillales bacterium]
MLKKASVVIALIATLILCFTGCGKQQQAVIGNFTDQRDTQSYRTVKIGELIWMAENLNFQTDNSWCYDDDASNCEKYGRLYSWDAAMGACPVGWRLPTDDDWNNLVQIAGGRDMAGTKLKSQTGWVDGGSGGGLIPGTDDFGFSAMPGGVRSIDGNVSGVGMFGGWWSATKDGNDHAWYQFMGSGYAGVDESLNPKDGGLFVRCVQYDRNVQETRQKQTATAEQEQSTFTDQRDSQTYRTVKIGNLTWMAQNLNHVTNGSWCYDDDASNCDKYGQLYTWDAAMAACPAGWRLPTDDDWDSLVQIAGGRDMAGRRLKSRTGWVPYLNLILRGTDDFDFLALPGGSRFVDGNFGHIGEFGFWWSATVNDAFNARFWNMLSHSHGVSTAGDDKKFGFSVRCVQYNRNVQETRQEQSSSTEQTQQINETSPEPTLTPLQRLLVDNDLYKPNMTAQDYNVAGMRFYRERMWPQAQAMFYHGALASFSGTTHVLSLYNLACVISIRLSESSPPENLHNEIPGSQRFNEWAAFRFLWLSTQLDPNRMARARDDSDFENLRAKDPVFFDAITLPQDQLERHRISGISFSSLFHVGTFVNFLRFTDANGKEHDFCTIRNREWVNSFVYSDEERWGTLKKGVAEKRFEIDYRYGASEHTNMSIERIVNDLRSDPAMIERLTILRSREILSVREL